MTYPKKRYSVVAVILFFATTVAIVLLLGCSGGKPGQQNEFAVWDDRIKFSRKAWDPLKRSKSKYILWEKCATQESCIFLNEFGPNQYREPFRIENLERCYGDDCEKLEQYGRTPHYQPPEGAFTFGERCIGKECERFTDYGPNSVLAPRENPLAPRCVRDECDRLEKFGGNGIIPYTERKR